MPIYATNNGNIGDYNTVSGVVSQVSGSHVDISGDYATHSGSVVNPHHVTLDEVENPDANVVFNFGNKTIEFRYAAPSPSADTGAFSIEAVGAFVGDLLHIHQDIGNPGPDTHLVHIAAADSDVHLLHITPADNTSSGICLDSGIFTLGNEARIVNSPDPTNAQDVATKIFVDNHNWTKADITDLDTTGYEQTSGDWASSSGTLSDYPVVSGDYSASSGDLSDYKTVSGDFAAGGDGAGTTHITGLTGGAWSVFYSEEVSGLITGLALGASGLVLSSVGETSAPVWSVKVAGGGDNLGSHEASKMLDMNTFKITGMGDPLAAQDAVTLQYGLDSYAPSGEYVALSGDIVDYPVVSGDVSTLDTDYAITSGAVADYPTLSGDYSASSGDVSDYKVVSGVVAAGGGGITGISELAAQAWTMFYNDAGAISGFILGASGLQLSSMGPSAIPIWSAAGAGAGDNLGSHEADKMLDMNTFKITGMGDPEANQDAATKIFVDNHNWTKGDITDLDTTGYEQASGDYSSHQALPNTHHIVTAINDSPTDAETTTGVSSNWAYDHNAEYTTTSGVIADYPAMSGDYASTSGTVSDYGVFSGAYSASSGDVADYKVVSGDTATALQNLTDDADPQLAADLDLNAFNISVAPSFGSDHQHEGLVVSITTDAGAYGDGLYMKSNGAYAQAQANAAGTMPCSAIYVASGKVLLIGTIRDDTWAFTIGGYVYISEATAGLFTTTAPSTSTNLVQKVGIAISADSMYFNPGGFRTVTVA